MVHGLGAVVDSEYVQTRTDTWRARSQTQVEATLQPVIARGRTFPTPVPGDSIPVFGADNVESPECHQHQDKYLRRVGVYSREISSISNRHPFRALLTWSR
jgi:hypothetical protein